MSLSWREAEGVCAENNAHLVSINNEEEWQFIKHHLNGYNVNVPLYSFTTASLLYIGLTKNQNDQVTLILVLNLLGKDDKNYIYAIEI